MRANACSSLCALTVLTIALAFPAGAAEEASSSGAAVELGPYVRYVTPSEAVVYWRTTEAGPSSLEYGLAGPGAKYSPSILLEGAHQGQLENRLVDERAKTQHAMRITGLRPNEVYAYRVKALTGGVEKSTGVYELDTALNYSVLSLSKDGPFSEDAVRHQQVQAVTREILRQGITQGYCLVWGLVDGSLAHALAANTNLTVIGVDDDADRIAAVRRRLYSAGVYGTRIAVQHVEDLSHVPYPDNFANLIVSERLLTEGRAPGAASEMFRVLRPRGGAAMFCDLISVTNGPSEAIEEWLNGLAVEASRWPADIGTLYLIEKATVPGIGSWTHQYGDTGNTADSHDDLSGANGTNDLDVQWLGKPGADFGADRNPRMPAPLAAAGKLFHQGMNRMVALDAYNGTILWSLEIPALQRVNLPRDASNWCTDDAMLYTAIEGKCWVLDHRNGDLKHVYTLPAEEAGSEWDWGYVAQQDGVLFGSAVKKGMAYTNFWGGASWYDKTSGYGTEKVCSDTLFAYDLQTRELLWTWRTGLVINTAIALNDNAMIFIESRHENIKDNRGRRLNGEPLWSDQYLVALNPRTGARLWETPIDTVDGIVVFFLSCTNDTIVVASSAAGNYHLYAYDVDGGAFLWHAEHKWTNDNHSGHMQHPVVLADRVFLEPCGYDLKSGRLLTSEVGRHEGCATYCGTKHALVYRGQSRRVAMWDINTGEITSWYNLRPSCWLSTIAGEGMVLSPEGGGGCSCGNWLETSLAFSPKKEATEVSAAQ